MWVLQYVLARDADGDTLGLYLLQESCETPKIVDVEFFALEKRIDFWLTLDKTSGHLLLS